MLVGLSTTTPIRARLLAFQHVSEVDVVRAK